MSTYPNSTRLVKGGIMLINPETSALHRIIALLYNPDSLGRRLQVKSVGEGADRSETLRSKGLSIEMIKVEAEISATDRSDSSGQNPKAVQLSIQPRLAALKLQPKPLSMQLLRDEDRARPGTGKVVVKEATRIRLMAASPLFPCLISGAINRQSNSIKAKQVYQIIRIQHQL